MVLSDKDILENLNSGKLIIKDLDLETQLGPSSVDLRLGNKFRVFKISDHSMIDLLDYEDIPQSTWETKDTKVEECTFTRLYISEKPFIIHPGEFVLASLREYVEIPDDMVGRLEGRSSLGRLGLMVHSTAGYVDPGFKGYLTLELANVGKLPVKLYPGMRICQMVFQMMRSPALNPYGSKSTSKYQDEKGATQSRINIDEDLKRARIQDKNKQPDNQDTKKGQ